MVTPSKQNGTVVHFVQSKVTPGAIKFDEVDAEGNLVADDAAGKKVGTLYLRKTGFAGNPARLRVTIEVL